MIINSKQIFITAALVLLTVGMACAQEVRFPSREGVVAEDVVNAIETQTGYRVSYNSNTFDMTHKVAIPSESMQIKDLLGAMTKGTGATYVISGNFIALVPGRKESPKSAAKPVVEAVVEAEDDDLYVEESAEKKVEREQIVIMPAPEQNNGTEPTDRQEWHSEYQPLDPHETYTKALPDWGIKTNIVYGLTTLTPNLGVEAALSPRSTLGVSYSNNPWKYKRTANADDNRKLLHGAVSLEYRYWLCERFQGHFLGANAIYAKYNISNHNIPLLFDKEYRYQGDAYGGGITYGYNLPAGKRWNVEFTVGVGVLRMQYDRFSCRTCDTEGNAYKKTYIGPTKLGINLVYLFK